ncbi:MAG: GNAT family N-acetyltransferase [Actinomycetales bacterium]
MEVPMPVELRVGTFRLNVPGPSDLADVMSALDDPEISQWSPHRPDSVSMRERADAWIEQRMQWSLEHCSWVIRDHDGFLIGQVSLFHIDRAAGDAEIGYWLVPRARRRGIAAASVEAATGYAFRELGVHRIQLFHAVGNPASCRLAMRCGFLLEGTLREGFRYNDGLRHDEHLHARLGTDPRPHLPEPR